MSSHASASDVSWYVCYDPRTSIIWGVGSTIQAAAQDAIHWQRADRFVSVIRVVDATFGLVREVMSRGALKVKWRFEKFVAMTIKESQEVRAQNRARIVREYQRGVLAGKSIADLVIVTKVAAKPAQTRKSAQPVASTAKVAAKVETKAAAKAAAKAATKVAAKRRASSPAPSRLPKAA